MTRPHRNVNVCVVVLILGTASAVRADWLSNIGTGLGYLGFNVEGQRNFLSGGSDLLINNNFRGTPIDYGVGNLTLAGPVSLQVSSGHRFLDTLDFSLRTAVNGNAAASPLAYSLTADVGSQAARLDGTLLMDANLSLDAFGFYDLSYTYSSMETVTRAGRFDDGSTPFNTSVGPLRIRGNVFADVLAFITDPFFQAPGAVNPFAHFSGSAQLKAIMEASADAAAQRLLSNQGDNPMTPFPGTFGNAALFPLASVSLPQGAAVPEPAVLILMLVGLPFILRRRVPR